MLVSWLRRNCGVVLHVCLPPSERSFSTCCTILVEYSYFTIFVWTALQIEYHACHTTMSTHNTFKVPIFSEELWYNFSKYSRRGCVCSEIPQRPTGDKREPIVIRGISRNHAESHHFAYRRTPLDSLKHGLVPGRCRPASMCHPTVSL